VGVRELSARLSLHPNTLRPHLRRLEEVGLVSSETRKGTGAGRPQTVYSALDVDDHAGRDFRLLAEILTPLVSGARKQERAHELAREWGAYLVARSAPKPAARRAPGPDLAVLQEAMAEAGFDPRFRRRSARTVDITLRACPFRELRHDHADLICGIHQGLLEGMLGASRPALTLTAFQPDPSGACRASARVRAS
jgi:predicted ArsR family transcriptional regulator